MASNTLTARTDGETIPAADHNELVQALLNELVPRNASRVPQDLAGSLGTSLLRWLRIYAQTYHIGDAANNLIIYEGAPGEIWISNDPSKGEILKVKDGSFELWTNNALRFTVDDTGINWGTIVNSTIPSEKIAAKSYVSGFAAGATNTTIASIFNQNVTTKTGKVYLITLSYNTLSHYLTNTDIQFLVDVGVIDQYNDSASFSGKFGSLCFSFKETSGPTLRNFQVRLRGTFTNINITLAEL